MDWWELEPSVQPSYEPTAEQVHHHDEFLTDLQKRFLPEKTLDEINEWITNEIREDEREMVEIIAERILHRRQDYLACRVPQESPSLRAAYCLGGPHPPVRSQPQGSKRIRIKRLWYIPGTPRRRPSLWLITDPSLTKRGIPVITAHTSTPNPLLANCKPVQ